EPRPMIKAFRHRQHGHQAQENNEAAGPASGDRFAFALLHRLEAGGLIVVHRVGHGKASSPAPSGAKWRSTSASLTPASAAGFQRGLLSLSTITARTPS